jgi:hypothetical protein
MPDSGESDNKKPVKSDAVLSCPCCFNVVCIECQRHDYYAYQYRAMFALNVSTLPEARSMQKGSTELYRSVVCSVCEAEVGVQDEDDVFHFFNVIPGTG